MLRVMTRQPGSPHRPEPPARPHARPSGVRREARRPTLDAGAPFGTLLFAANRHLEGWAGAFFADAPIAPPQVSILLAVSEDPGRPLVAYSDLLRIDPATFLRRVNALAAAGLLLKERGRDGRERVLRLAPEGRAALDAALAAVRRLDGEIAEEMGADEFRALKRALAGFLAAGNGRAKG